MTVRTVFYILSVILMTSCDFKSADEYLKEGHNIGLTGNYNAAIQAFNKAIQKDPKLREAYIQRGLCHEYNQQDSLAINDYKQLLSFDPKNTSALYYTGLCKFRQKKFEEAIDFYNKALVTKGVSDPSDTSAMQIVINMDKNGILADQAAFDVASYEIYYNRGLAYYSVKEIKRAFYDFQNCVQQGYMPGESNYMIGLCWIAAGKKDKACEMFRKGILLYRDSLSAMRVLELCK